MARLCTLASSSSGNCILLSDGNRHLMIDMGISLKRTTMALAELNLGINDLTGVLVTHSHSDHICGLNTLCKRWNVPIFATKPTARGIMAACPETSGCVLAFEEGASFDLKDFGIRSFSTPHDSDGSVCFRVSHSGGDLGIMTDLGYVPPKVLLGMEGVSAIVLESNHDVARLMAGPYPYHLKQRIISDRGHLSNETAGETAAWLADHGTEKFILAHLSKENNTPALAYQAVCAALAGYPGVSLYVAPPEMGQPIEV